MSTARMWLANAVYLLGAILYAPVLLYQMVFQAKNRRGWKQRFGFVPVRYGVRPAIWIHAVSLGEVNLTRVFVEQIRRRLPGFELLVSTTTDTGYARACALYGPENVFRFPLDFSWCMRRAIRRVRPSVIVLVELEVWHNLSALARAHGIPVVVINGRLSEKSFSRYRRVGWLVRPMFESLAFAAVQDQVSAERFKAIGVPADRVVVTGSMKFDTAQVADGIEGAESLAALLGVTDSVKLWVAGQTGPGEESIVLEAHRRVLREVPEARLAIVPRKPERFDEAASLIAKAGFRPVRRSRMTAEGAREALAEDEVILGDTLGELRKFYSIAEIAFVGRSLVPMGGSDMMEAAGLAKPVIVGPYTANFAEPVRLLLAAEGAMVVHDGEELAETLIRLFQDPARAATMGKRGQETIRSNQGASKRTVDMVCELLGFEPNHPERTIAPPAAGRGSQASVRPGVGW